MPYKITITKVEVENWVRRGGWKVIDKRPWRDDELSEASDLYRSKEAIIQKEPLKEILGYTPDVPSTKEVEVKVLEQTVDTLNLVEVIKAINQIESK